ncbi:hypothetical protein KCP73_13375 [Salmonella enterica subsp. enterica]|nr:hypothetical protein KCP73_13375 [Salmonella enterica subsp. enterica]
MPGFNVETYFHNAARRLRISPSAAQFASFADQRQISLAIQNCRVDVIGGKPARPLLPRHRYGDVCGKHLIAAILAILLRRRATHIYLRVARGRLWRIRVINGLFFASLLIACCGREFLPHQCRYLRRGVLRTLSRHLFVLAKPDGET